MGNVGKAIWFVVFPVLVNMSGVKGNMDSIGIAFLPGGENCKIIVNGLLLIVVYFYRKFYFGIDGEDSFKNGGFLRIDK